MSEMNEYTPDLFTLVDENGKEQTFELLDAIEVDENRYYALIPYLADPDILAEDDGEFVILKVDSSDEEEMLISIEDEDEFDRIGEIFLKRIEEMYEDDDDCDCDDCNCEHNN